MYKGLELRVGAAPGAADAQVGTKADMFRLDDDTPILGDKRNDENKIVSQFHSALIRFHNKVVTNDELIASFGGDPILLPAVFAPRSISFVGTINRSSSTTT